MRRLELAIALMFACGVAMAAKPPKTVELSATGRDNVMLAQSYLEAKQIDVAEEHARTALQSDPGSALTHATMAMVRAQQDKQDKAQEEFKRALALAPDDGAVLNAYGAWQCARGDRAGADASFQHALQDATYATPIQPLVNAGQCAFLGQDWNKGDGYLRRALVMAPQSRLILLLLAEAQLRLQRPLEARAFVQRSDDLGPDPTTISMAVRVEVAAGDEAAAAKYRKRLQDEFPNFAPTGEGARKP